MGVTSISERSETLRRAMYRLVAITLVLQVYSYMTIISACTDLESKVFGLTVSRNRSHLRLVHTHWYIIILIIHAPGHAVHLRSSYLALDINVSERYK